MRCHNDQLRIDPFVPNCLVHEGDGRKGSGDARAAGHVLMAVGSDATGVRGPGPKWPLLAANDLWWPFGAVCAAATTRKRQWRQFFGR